MVHFALVSSTDSTLQNGSFFLGGVTPVSGPSCSHESLPLPSASALFDAAGRFSCPLVGVSASLLVAFAPAVASCCTVDSCVMSVLRTFFPFPIALLVPSLLLPFCSLIVFPCASSCSSYLYDCHPIAPPRTNSIPRFDDCP